MVIVGNVHAGIVIELSLVNLLKHTMVLETFKLVCRNQVETLTFNEEILHTIFTHNIEFFTLIGKKSL